MIKNNKFINNIFILLISGMMIYFLSLFEKITYTQIAGIEVIKLYNLILPIIIFIILLSSFSLTISVSKIVAEHKYNDNEILKSAFIIGFIINIFMIIITLLLSKYISVLLHNTMLLGPIRTICIIIPLSTILSIQRGYLHGKEDMFIPSLVNIFEIIIKIILICLFLKNILHNSKVTVLYFLILINLATDFFSVIILGIRIKKYIHNVSKVKLNKIIVKKIINIAGSITLIRIISSINMVIEPIILTNILLIDGYNIDYINYEYAMINSYVIPTINFPIFISNAIATALLPNLTKLYVDKKYTEFNKKIFIILFIIIIIGIIFIILLLLYSDIFINILYKIKINKSYVYLLAPSFILVYISPILSIIIQACNYVNKLLYVSIISTIVKYLSLLFFVYKGLGIISFCLSIIIDIVISMLLMIVIIISIKEPKN